MAQVIRSPKVYDVCIIGSGAAGGKLRGEEADEFVAPNGPDKNPTLSILALSWRASEYLLQQSRKGEL